MRSVKKIIGGVNRKSFDEEYLSSFSKRMKRSNEMRKVGQQIAQSMDRDNGMGVDRNRDKIKSMENNFLTEKMQQINQLNNNIKSRGIKTQSFQGSEQKSIYKGNTINLDKEREILQNQIEKYINTIKYLKKDPKTINNLNHKSNIKKEQSNQKLYKKSNKKKLFAF